MSEDNGLRKYRTELPNIVDDMGLSVYAYRLYGHVKRVCGANNGVCYQGVRTLADVCDMSITKVASAKKELLDRGLITVQQHANGERLADEIRVVDIWEKNFAAYAPDPKVDHKNKPYILRAVSRKDLATRMADVAREKRTRAARHAAWAMLPREQQVKELQKYRNYAKKYPTTHWWEADVWYLELLTGE